MWKKTGSTCSILQCRPRQEKCSECGNQTLQQGASWCEKNWTRSNLLKENWDHFVQWMNVCHTDCMLTVQVCELNKLSYLSVLIGIDIMTLHYIRLHFIVFDVDVLWVWVIVIYKLYSDFLHVQWHMQD
jgi:hypothetical protein